MHSVADYGSWQLFQQSSLIEVVLTTNKPLRSLFERPECGCCIHTCPDELHRGGKQNLVSFNPTK